MTKVFFPESRRDWGKRSYSGSASEGSTIDYSLEAIGIICERVRVKTGFTYVTAERRQGAGSESGSSEGSVLS